MDEKAIKYLGDIINSISEIEAARQRFGNRDEIFMSDVVFRKFVERNIEIMGEAMNRVLRLHPDINITSARKVVDTRNYVIHSYDSLKPDILWAIVVNHLPVLKAEIEELLKNY